MPVEETAEDVVGRILGDSFDPNEYGEVAMAAEPKGWGDISAGQPIGGMDSKSTSYTWSRPVRITYFGEPCAATIKVKFTVNSATTPQRLSTVSPVIPYVWYSGQEYTGGFFSYKADEQGVTSSHLLKIYRALQRIETEVAGSEYETAGSCLAVMGAILGEYDDKDMI